MLNGYKIIDADSHVIEPQDMWVKYLEPEFKEFAPSKDMRIKGEPITEKISQQVQQEGNKQMMESHPHAYLNRYSAESHVQSMVQMGVDLAFVYPTYGLWLFAIDQKIEDLLTGKTDLFGMIFEPEEIKDYLIQIDWSSFEGSVVDNPQPTIEQKPPYFIINLPYPPRPDNFNLNMQDEDLQAWLDEEVNVNSPEEVTNPFPPIPYLPQTTS